MIFGTESSTGKFVGYHVDFSALHPTKCKLDLSNPENDDFELWSPEDTRGEACLFGREVNLMHNIKGLLTRRAKPCKFRRNITDVSETEIATLVRSSFSLTKRCETALAPLKTLNGKSIKLALFCLNHATNLILPKVTSTMFVTRITDVFWFLACHL